MTGPCGAQTRDVHGDAVCALDAGHRGGHSGEVMAGIYLSWSAAPPLSPEEREIVQRFESAPDGLLEDDLCDCGSGATRAECDPAYGGGSTVVAIFGDPDGTVTTFYSDRAPEVS